MPSVRTSQSMNCPAVQDSSGTVMYESRLRLLHTCGSVVGAMCGLSRTKLLHSSRSIYFCGDRLLGVSWQHSGWYTDHPSRTQVWAGLCCSKLTNFTSYTEFECWEKQDYHTNNPQIDVDKMLRAFTVLLVKVKLRVLRPSRSCLVVISSHFRYRLPLSPTRW